MLHYAEITLENEIKGSATFKNFSIAYYTSIRTLSVLVDILQYSVSFYTYNHFCSLWKDVGDFFFLSFPVPKFSNLKLLTNLQFYIISSILTYHFFLRLSLPFSSHLTSPQLHHKALSHQ